MPKKQKTQPYATEQPKVHQVGN